MNAVATPARKAAPKARKSAAAPKEVLPDWDNLARCVSNDLAEVNAQIAALADSVASGSAPLTSIGTLLEEAHDHLDEIRASINTRPLVKAITDEAYTRMFKPLALVEGAIAMAVKVEADIISPTLRVVHELLNEAQNSLADVVLGVMLPVLPESGADLASMRTDKTAAPADSAGSEEEAAYRELARSAAYEIQKLAEAMQIVNEQMATEDHPITHGVMARISMLSEIVFHAAALHGGTRSEWGGYALADLQRKFRGAL